MQPNYNSAALSLPELLEYILLFVDMRTLLTSAQRVCRQWHEVINLSPSIQQSLFFKPIQPNLSNERQERIRNPLLGDAFWSLASPWNGEYWDKPYAPASYIPFENKDLERRLGQENASWRRMLIQQPPTSKIGIIRGFHPVYDMQLDTTHWQFLIKPNQDHLRMESVITGLQSLAIRPCRSTRWGFWDKLPKQYLEFLGDYAQVLLNAALQECDLAIIVNDEDGIIDTLSEYLENQEDHGNFREPFSGKQFAMGFPATKGRDMYNLVGWLQALRSNATRHEPILGGSMDKVREAENLLCY